MSTENRYSCNLIVAGFPKCGTSSLHDYLDQHPDICMSLPKEPHFFSRVEHWQKGFKFHNNLFREQDKTFYGESTTTYCISLNAMERIGDSLLLPKIILVMRDPVERVLSHYRWMYKLGLETDSLIKAIENDSKIKFNSEKDISGCYKSYIEFSRYSQFVPKWIKRFGKEQVFLISSEELRDQPLDSMNKCFKFLELSPLQTLNSNHRNVTEDTHIIGTECISKTNFIHKVKLIISKKNRDKVLALPLVKKVWRRLTSGINVIPPQIKDDEIKKIECFLKEETIFYQKLFK